MTDHLTPEDRSKNMRLIRDTGMKPEIAVRQMVHALGYRFRLHRKDLPGKPDLVFPSRRKVIFVHGCFWHQHSDCRRGGIPKSNIGYWNAKLARNVERDAEVIRRLMTEGWHILIVWECETGDSLVMRERLKTFLA